MTPATTSAPRTPPGDCRDQKALHRVAAALVADAMAASVRWNRGAERYPGTVPAEHVELILADNPNHARIEVGKLMIAAWMESNRGAIRVAAMCNGAALTARCCDTDSLHRLMRWTASRLDTQLLH